MGGIIRLLGWTVLAAGLAMLMAWWHMGAAVVILLSGFGGNALLLPALVFAAAHQGLWSAPVWLLGPLVIGLVCGWVVYLSGSLLEAWLIHGLWNLTAIGASPYLISLAGSPQEVRMISGLAAGLGISYLTLLMLRQGTSVRVVRASDLGAKEVGRAGV
jgi:hypothetical protein